MAISTPSPPRGSSSASRASASRAAPTRTTVHPETEETPLDAAIRQILGEFSEAYLASVYVEELLAFSLVAEIFEYFTDVKFLSSYSHSHSYSYAASYALYSFGELGGLDDDAS